MKSDTRTALFATFASATWFVAIAALAKLSLHRTVLDARREALVQAIEHMGIESTNDLQVVSYSHTNLNVMVRPASEDWVISNGIKSRLSTGELLTPPLVILKRETININHAYGSGQSLYVTNKPFATNYIIGYFSGTNAVELMSVER